MSYLVASIPPIEVFIKKEFLYDFQLDNNEKLLGEGEFESAHWISTKSIPNQALYFESLIHDFGALYDKLPLHAYVWKTDIKENEMYPQAIQLISINLNKSSIPSDVPVSGSKAALNNLFIPCTSVTLPS